MDRYFVFVAKTPRMLEETYPPFFHKSRNGNHQTQKENISNEKSYQKMKRAQKNHVKNLYPQE